MRWSRWLTAAALMGLAAVCWLPRIRGPIDLRWDAAVYYILGSSLAQGMGYRLLNEPGHIHAVQYPPALPAAIAFDQVVAGTSDPVRIGNLLRLQYGALFVLYVAAVWLFALKFLPAAGAFLVSSICLLNPYTNFLSEQATADFPFAVVAAAALFSATGPGRRRAALTAALVIAATMLRTAGITLLLAWVIATALERRFRAAALRLVLCLIPLAAWFGYVRSIEAGPEFRQPAYPYQRADYLFYNVTYGRNALMREPYDPPRGRITAAELLFSRLPRNLIRMPHRAGEALTSQRGFWALQQIAITYATPDALPHALHLRLWLIDPLLVSIGLAAFAGLAIMTARGQWLPPLFALLSIAAISLAPWPEMNRYLTPLMPVIAVAFLTLLLEIRRFPWKRTGSVCAAGLGLLVISQEATALWQFLTEYHQETSWQIGGAPVRYRLFFYFDSYRELDHALDWLRANAKPDEIVANSMPHWCWLRSGLKAVMPPFETDASRAQELLDSVPVRYIVLQREAALDLTRFIEPVLRQLPSAWEKVWSDGRDLVMVYRRRH